jgi:6-phosphogluconolactonase
MPDLPHITHDFASRQALAHALASTVASRLDAALGERGEATLAVSGGTTPGLFFEALSHEDIAWKQVTITLVDERFIEASSPRSNEGLVRRALLRDKAAAARFLPLYRNASDVVEAARQTSAELEILPWPLDVVVLGMGTDGHTASFFPDAPDLADLLDPAESGLLRVVTAPSAGEPRLTLSLPRLASARFIALHVEGAEKRDVLAAALRGATAPPIAAVLAQAEHTVQIYWAP